MGAAIKGSPQIAAASPALLSAPLDFFLSGHFRQRQFFDCLDRLAAAADLDRDLAAEVVVFLRLDMALHVLDEEQGLFPLMRLTCRPEDEIDSVLSALSAERAGYSRLAGQVIAGLEAALAAAQPLAAQAGLGEAVTDFAGNERRHLARENSVVLPLARLRLKADDLADLSARMIARRGATLPGGDERSWDARPGKRQAFT